MTPLSRRKLIAGTAAALTAPAWIREAWAAEDTRPALRQAWQAAQEAGRPLLVPVVPEAAPWERLRYWGPFLNYAPDPVMARLGLCDPACATPAAIREVLGLTRAPDDAPWIWLLAPGKEPVAADIAPVTPPKIEQLQEASAALDTWDQIARDLRARAPQCLPEADLTMVGEVLEQAKAILLERDPVLLMDLEPFLMEVQRTLADAADCAGDTATLERLSHTSVRITAYPEYQERLILTDLHISALSELITRATTPLALPADTAALTASGIERWRRRAPPNTRWGYSGGCGSVYERDDGSTYNPNPGIMCGMGHVPARLARFLSLYTGAR